MSLRVAVAVPESLVPRWVADCLLHLQREPEVELVLRVHSAPAPRAGGALARAYERIDRRLFARPDDSLAPTPLDPVTLRLPEPEGELAEALRRARVDVLLWLADGAGPGGLAERPGCELWSVRLRDGLLAGEAVTGVSLVRDSQVVARSFGATDFSSLHRGRATALAKAPGLLRRALRARASDPARESLGESDSAAPSRGALRVAASVGWRLLHNRIENRRSVEHWRMGVRPRPTPPLSHLTHDSFVELPSPAGHFYADPIPFEHRGERFVFFEDLDFATHKGVLRCTRLTADGQPAETRLVLERPYHLSYPFVFRWRDDIWMIPESEQNGTIELWRAAEFPWRWQLERALFEGVRAFDTTLLEQGGRLWMFVNLAEPRASGDDELFLFHADSLHGPWRPHPANPIVSDVRRARPAGPLFRLGESLIRPSQDCSRTYGGAIVLHRVDALNEAEYRETPISRIEPSWRRGAFGTHTIGVSEHLEVIDWKVRAPAREHRPR
jgi:hypothetical protein